MVSKQRAIVCAVSALASSSMAWAVPPPVAVNGFGDQGWYSDDTRSASGADLVGINSTYAGKPGQTPTAADDIAIGQQIQFVAGPSGSTYGGAVSIDGTSANSGKSNFSVIDLSGFDDASNLIGVNSTFNATYQWYGQPNPTTRTLAFKLGIQSTAWGTGAGESQNGFTATRSGESAWDLVLVHVPTSSSDYAWSTVNLDHDTGTWSLYRQAGNGFFSTAPDATPKTLDDWLTDATYGSLLFGTGAKVTSIQFGLGSSQRNSISYVDYLQTNLLNGGGVVDFQAVPEPASLGLLGIGAAALLLRRRRRA